MSSAQTNAQGRFDVSRVGTPVMPNSRYVVLDVTYDFEARVAARKLVNRYRHIGDHARAQEVEELLTESAPLHEEAMKARNPKSKEPKTQKRTHA